MTCASTATTSSHRCCASGRSDLLLAPSADAVENLSAEGEQARMDLADFMSGLDTKASRFEDKRDTLAARMNL